MIDVKTAVKVRKNTDLQINKQIMNGTKP